MCVSWIKMRYNFIEKCKKKKLLKKMKKIFGCLFSREKIYKTQMKTYVCVVGVACCVGWLAVWAVRGGGAM